MKTKLFILAMLLMPFICGCSKNYEQMIIGDWFQCYYELSYTDSENPSDNGKVVYEYTKETAEYFVSYTKDGKFTYSSKDGEVTISGTWSLEKGKLTQQYDDGYSDTDDIAFDGNNKFYMTHTESTDGALAYYKQGWRRM